MRGVAVVLEPAVGGRIGRDVVRAAGLHAAAQLGHDLSAEDFHLLERELLREPCVVDEEKLTLVVAHPVRELHGAIDNLLHGADGQWRLCGVVLERGTVAVDRRVVEVRTEGVLGFLLRVCDEDLASQADDGLICAAVAVLLVAAAVHRDHLRGVFLVPEDVVVEETVAVIRGLLCNLWGADGPMPDKRRHAVERGRGGDVRLQRRAELALPVDDGFAPQATKKVIILHGERDALADIFAEPRVDRAGIAPAHHEIHAAASEVLKEDVILGDLHGIVGRNQRRRR